MTTTFLRPELTGPNMSSTVSGFESKIQHSSDYPFHSQKDQCLSPTLPIQACCNIIVHFQALHKLRALGSLSVFTSKTYFLKYISFSSTK